MNSRIYYRVPIVWLTDAFEKAAFIYLCREINSEAPHLFILIDADGGWIKLMPKGSGYVGSGDTKIFPKDTHWTYNSISYKDGLFKMFEKEKKPISQSDLPGVFAAQEELYVQAVDQTSFPMWAIVLPRYNHRIL